MIDESRPVRVFRNWKRNCYSIMQDGVVRASAREVQLADVEFLVRASGRERMLASRRKNVHAYAVGRLVTYRHPDESEPIPGERGRRAFYDALRFPTFVDAETHAPVHTAPQVFLDDDGLHYLPDALPRAA